MINIKKKISKSPQNSQKNPEKVRFNVLKLSALRIPQFEYLFHLITLQTS